MAGESETSRRDRAAPVALIVAAIALIAFALGGAAAWFGWIAPQRVESAEPADSVASTARSPQKTFGSGPLMPKYSQPAPPPPAPPPSSAPTGVPPPPLPRAAVSPAPVPAPSAALAPSAPPPEGFRSSDPSGPGAPDYGRSAERRALADEDARAPRRAVCDHCGEVAAITRWPGSAWEVRVRFDDGSSRVIRFGSRPRLAIGDRVRFDDGFLVPD
jgi:hypothetical protein